MDLAGRRCGTRLLLQAALKIGAAARAAKAHARWSGDGSSDGILFEPAVVVDIGALGSGYLGAGRWPSEEWSTHAKPLQGFDMAPG